ncbi:hypothetical protein EIMP300_48010 [Escherichia coli]|uniref:Uncharacterized protein n=1 Tax=Escherichia coli TaxID=562 RepID=A0A8S0FSW9_ECOLX|nr:hypothetical protein EIMP300_48010 [Escherichia coli]
MNTHPADVWYLLPITAKLMVETEASGWLPAALDECRLMQMRRQEVAVQSARRPDFPAYNALPNCAGRRLA